MTLDKHKPNARGGNLVLSSLMIFMGLGGLAIVSYFYFFIISKIVRISNEFQATYNVVPVYLILGVFAGLSLIEFICGVITFKEKFNVKGSWARKVGTILLVLVAISFLLYVPFLVFSVILPIYNLTSALK